MRFTNDFKILNSEKNIFDELNFSQISDKRTTLKQRRIIILFIK